MQKRKTTAQEQPPATSLEDRAQPAVQGKVKKDKGKARAAQTRGEDPQARVRGPPTLNEAGAGGEDEIEEVVTIESDDEVARIRVRILTAVFDPTS